jgi:DNA repair exonuclease SbcCD nuclease subunit
MNTSPLRILHVADVHLDTPFYGRKKETRQKLRNACRDAFKSAVDEALKRNVHCFLIAGDLFDNELLTFTTEQFLLDMMNRLYEADIDVFYATGNHDPGDSHYRAQHLNWPTNVHIFSTSEPETYPITDNTGQTVGLISGIGHSTNREDRNLARKLKNRQTEMPHIAVLHTQVVSAESSDMHDRYAPCTEDDLANGGFDYWALGHIHRQQRISESLPAYYPGNIQGRTPRETGPKGAIYAEVSNNAEVKTEFIAVAPIIWHSITLPCPKTSPDFESLVDAIGTELMRQVDFHDDHRHIVRSNLTGDSPLAHELQKPENLEELTDRLEGRTDAIWLELRIDSVVQPTDPDEYRGSTTVLGEALDLIDELRNDEDILRTVFPQELANKNIPDLTSYIRSLTENIEKELIDRLES